MVKKILASAHHWGSANSLVPVLKKLAENERIELVPLAFNRSMDQRALENAGLDFDEWGDFELTGQPVKLEDITSELAEEVLTFNQPDLVLVGSSTETVHNGPEKSLTIAARKLDIPTVGILDFNGDHALRYKDLETGLCGAALPDTLCLPDKDSALKMANVVDPVNSKSLFVTGNPFYDSVLERLEGMSNSERLDLRGKLSEEDNILFYIANAYETHKDDERFQHGFWDLDNLKILEEFLESSPNTGLGINLHYRYPEADPEGYAKLLTYVASQERMHIVDKEIVGSLEGAIVSDVVVTPFSTDGISAAVAGKFAISMQPGYMGDRLPTNELGVTYRADDVEKVRAAINDVLVDPNKIIHYCPNLDSFKSDGKATDRIVDIVNSVLRN